MTALKPENVGLSVCSLGSGFFAAVVASLSTFSFPVMPLWPGHHLRVILTCGASFSNLVISEVALTLCVSACDVVFLDDISLTTPWLSKIIVTFLVVVANKYFAMHNPRVSPTYSASKKPYSTSFPSRCVLKCFVFSHKAAVAVFLFSICDSSE